jgi:steroid 5-alpha reductase family enzyme
VLTSNILFFFYCQYKKDNGLIDVFWGFTFIIADVAVLVSKYSRGFDINIRSWVVLAMALIWGLRLSIHIGLRHQGKEDFRYAEMRANWMAQGKGTYYCKTIGYIFLMQGVFSLIINSASLYTLVYSIEKELLWTDYTGIVIFLFGFIFEVVGDEQLKSHLKNKSPEKGKFIKWGLWRYTRHPNYFGESVLWWGPFLIACSTQYGWITIFSPVFMGLLIRYVSGVPLLEKKYENNPEF